MVHDREAVTMKDWYVAYRMAVIPIPMTEWCIIMIMIVYTGYSAIKSKK